ncbi:MAG: alpha/beta hydrolase [Gammaproteobacteria bacterium]|nr:alpha/beta hydrolase [Gammaproteobacteria bacterium]
MCLYFTAPDGAKLSYLAFGGGDQVVVLIHGLGVSSKDWRPQFKALAQEFRVIVPDWRGFGHAMFPLDELLVEQVSADIAALMDHLDIDQYHVAGASAGGAVAFQHALDFSEHVLSLTALNSQPTFQLGSPFTRAGLWKRAMVLDRMVRSRNMNKLAAHANKSVLVNDRIRARRLRVLLEHLPSRENYRLALNAIQRWSVVDRLRSLNKPVLMLASDRDLTSVEEKERLMRTLPDLTKLSFEVLVGAGHAANWEQPDVVNDHMMRFLRRHSAAAV